MTGVKRFLLDSVGVHSEAQLKHFDITALYVGNFCIWTTNKVIGLKMHTIMSDI